MSLESALDEERRDILAILEGKPLPSARHSVSTRGRAPSPAGSTQSPIRRSMLDLGDFTEIPPAAARHASIAGQGVGVTSPPQRIRSMLDPISPVLAPTKSISPTSPPTQAPRINVEKDYTFEVQDRDQTNAVPIRASQPEKGLFGSYDKSSRSEGNQTRHGKQQKSRSPSWLGGRHTSPNPNRKLNSNSGTLMTGPNTYITDTGQRIDMTNAWRRLSDANLMKSGSSLAALSARKTSDVERGESLAPDGGVRLTKDFTLEDEEGAISSDEDSNSSDEENGSDSKRGRGRTRDGGDSPEVSDKRQAKSLLAAAEDERVGIVANQKYKSLLDPVATNIDIDGKMTHAKRTGVHPNTNFDVGDGNEPEDPNDSGDEEVMDDIAKAQSLSLRVSKISSDAAKYRCIRTVIRGDYAKIEEDAKVGLRRQRLYLVATDLSEEAAYALEWTIGTVLRDGDTLFAVYAMDIGDVGGDSSDALSTSSAMAAEQQNAPNSGDGTRLMENTYKMVRVLSNAVESTIPAEESLLDPNKAGGSERSHSRRSSKLRFGSINSPDVRGMSKAERERHKAVEMITDRCVHLLRKTKLQIRIIIDVVHCKSPRHIITEVIDYLTPTLVILGSRGRSQVKNVLLGSFSNYLVTKSSVPVMVARKKLKKNKSFKRSNIRLSNVLQPSTHRRLANANIEKAIAKSDTL